MGRNQVSLAQFSANLPQRPQAAAIGVNLEREALILQISEALEADDENAMIRLGEELKKLGRAKVAKANAVTTLESVVKRWVEEEGLDPRPLFALALMLEAEMPAGRKWARALDCALTALKPDLGYNTSGIFRTPPGKAGKAMAGLSIQQKRGLEERRKNILKKMKNAVGYRKGPLAACFAATLEDWRRIVA